MSELREAVADLNPDALCVDGFDHCIIGYAERIGLPILVAYDREQMIETLTSDSHGMSIEEAEEFFDFNILGAYMGENTPLFITQENPPQSLRTHIYVHYYKGSLLCMDSILARGGGGTKRARERVVELKKMGYEAFSSVGSPFPRPIADA